MRTQGIGHWKIPKDPTGNRNQNLPSCGTEPQPAASPSCTIQKSLTRRHEKKHVKLVIILFSKVNKQLVNMNGIGGKMIDLRLLQQCGVWGYVAMSLGEQFLTFRFTVLPLYSLSNSVRRITA